MLSNSERRRPAARTTRHHSEVHSPCTLWVSCVCLVLARKNCTRPTDAKTRAYGGGGKASYKEAAS
eukprot:2572521-Pyramimonas_sp.AAC.1